MGLFSVGNRGQAYSLQTELSGESFRYCVWVMLSTAVHPCLFGQKCGIYCHHVVQQSNLKAEFQISHHVCLDTIAVYSDQNHSCLGFCHLNSISFVLQIFYQCSVLLFQCSTNVQLCSSSLFISIFRSILNIHERSHVFVELERSVSDLKKNMHLPNQNIVFTLCVCGDGEGGGGGVGGRGLSHSVQLSLVGVNFCTV